jgi:translation initiation factor 3 subunit M
VLQIKADEVESWVVAAIGAELIDAKMDQLRRIVIIRSARVPSSSRPSSHLTFSRATQRVFTDQQWKQLATSLNTWRDNLSHILKVIQTTTTAAAKQAERDA